MQILPFLNNPKDLDLSYKTDIDLWDCFGRKKTLSYNRRNMVPAHSREIQRVRLHAKPQFTGFFRDILHARTLMGKKKIRVSLFLKYKEVVS